MNTHSDDPRNLDFAQLLAAGEQLLAAATIALNQDGEYTMHVADVDGAPVTMTPFQKAHALRMLATAVEAESIFKGTDSGGLQPAPEPNAPDAPIGYGLLIRVPDASAVYLGEDAAGEFTAPFETPEQAISWLRSLHGQRRDDAVVSTVAIVPLEQIKDTSP